MRPEPDRGDMMLGVIICAIIVGAFLFFPIGLWVGLQWGLP